MSRVPVLAFCLPLAFTLALLVWRETGQPAHLPKPPSKPTQALPVPAPSGPTDHSDDIVGEAFVTDGDTINVGGTKIRLHGIDAPESRQACEREGRSYLCGDRATQALQELLRGHTVRCHRKG